MRLIAAFFGRRNGYFVEVGANEPRERSQTYHLEQAGWTVACSGPQNARQMLPFHVAGPLSSLNRESMAPGAAPEAVIEVPIRTLDSILAEAGAPEQFDFLSIDVEGHEIEVLRGFDIARWQPQLILPEDHVADLSKHCYLKAAGYRLIRRYENNGWYVPLSAAATISWPDRWEILRKYFLALPFRRLRNLSRRLRKG
jgi:FkbM family methyltransferase